jgi:hypothetical protein
MSTRFVDAAIGGRNRQGDAVAPCQHNSEAGPSGGGGSGIRYQSVKISKLPLQTPKKNRIVGAVLRAIISTVAGDDANLLDLLDDLQDLNVDDIPFTHEPIGPKKCRKHIYDFLLGSRHNHHDSQDNVNKNGHDSGSGNETPPETHEPAKDEHLSLRKIAVNFHTLSLCLGDVASNLKGLRAILNWTQNEKTLFVLLLYTWACIYPYFFLLYPLIYFVHYLSKRYLERHPIVTKPSSPTSNANLLNHWDSGLGPRLKNTHSERSCGLFGFLWEDDDGTYKEGRDEDGDIEDQISSQIENGKLEETFDSLRRYEDAEFQELEELYRLLEEERKNTTTEAGTTMEDESMSLNNKVRYKNFIMRTLYNVQLQTNIILNFIDSTQKFVDDHCKFHDEKQSTMLLYKVLSICFIGCVLGPYIPWKLIFVVGVWIGMVINHPYRKELFKNALIVYQGKTARRGKEKMKKPTQSKENKGVHKAVIIDEPAFSREVEVYELAKQDLLHPTRYEFYGFCSTVFNVSEEQRVQRRKPQLVFHLEDVKPPEEISMKWEYSDTGTNDEDEEQMGDSATKKLRGDVHWSFINGEEWTLSESTGWMFENNCYHELYSKEDREGWVYDITGEFRRRRWTRRVIRHLI